MRRQPALRAGLLLLVMAGPTQARAQSVDHTAFEQLFGEPVTTSVTGKPQRASEVPAEMEIVTADDIRRSGADNIPDVLQFVAGLNVRRYGSQDAAVGIRGYNTPLNPRVLVLLDGRQVYQDDYGFTLWPLVPVPLAAIRQIEIIKGPSAALYGANAVSGVINILTYDPLRDPVNALGVSGGTQNQIRGEAVTTVQVPDRVGVRLSGTGFRSAEFKDTNNSGTINRAQSVTAAADIRVQLAPGVEWDLSGSFSSHDGNLDVDDGVYETIHYKTNSVRSQVSADTAVGLLRLDAYRNEDREASVYAGWREDVTVVQASDVLKIGSANTVRVGAEYRDNSAASLAAFNGRIGYTIVAGSAMWDWQILPSLSLTNAVRVDDLSLAHEGAQFNVPGRGGLYHPARRTEPSFNSGAVLKVSDYDTVRLTAARAIQLPSLFDFGYADNIGPVIVTGNTGLQPSAVQNYELDYDRALPSIGSTLRIAAFAQRTYDTIGPPFDSGLAILPNGQVLLAARNFRSSDAAGGEIGIKGGSASGLRWNASYALASVHDATPKADLLSASSVSYQRQTATHSIIVGGGYSRGRLEIDVQARWQSHFEDFKYDPNTLASMPVAVPNYLTVHGRVAYRLTDHITASVVGDQLNRNRLSQTAGLQVERRIIVGLAARF